MTKTIAIFMIGYGIGFISSIFIELIDLIIKDKKEKKDKK